MSGSFFDAKNFFSNVLTRSAIIDTIAIGSEFVSNRPA